MIWQKTGSRRAKRAAAGTAAVIAVLGWHTGVSAEKSEETALYDSCERFFESDRQTDQASGPFFMEDMLLLSDMALPSRYSSAEHGRSPVVKSQGSYGTCWALAATTALETALLPDEHRIFSADHLALKNDFEVPVDEGGDYLMTMAYLSSWQGPVEEKSDPYGDAYSPDGLEPVVHVQEMQLYDGASKEEIKKAIYEYGAVQTSLYMNRQTIKRSEEYYNPWMSTYYDADEHVQDHDIIILGWDDTISRFQFCNIPQQDGAWICQNSWGEAFGQDGRFCVSYEDVNIGRAAIVYSGIESTDNYDRIYQTDTCGWQGSQGYGDGICWIANTYWAEQEEELEAIGLYAVGKNTSWEIYCESSKDRSSERLFLKHAEVEYPGYYTVRLDTDTPLRLTAGEPFTVVVKIHTPDVTNPAPVEYRADWYTQNVTTEGKYGYISHDGEDWVHTEEKYGTNICLKAYTNVVGEK